METLKKEEEENELEKFLKSKIIMIVYYTAYIRFRNNTHTKYMKIRY